MNERLELSYCERYVHVKSHADHSRRVCYELTSGELTRQGWDTEKWDDAGLEADALVNACYRQTKSFAALADTSAVPFCGKRMRAREYAGEHTIELIKSSTRCLCYQDGANTGVWVDASHLLPLTAPEPPAPKFRPFTPVEAAAHLGRKLTHDGTGEIVGVDERRKRDWIVRPPHLLSVAGEPLQVGRRQYALWHPTLTRLTDPRTLARNENDGRANR